MEIKVKKTKLKGRRVVLDYFNPVEQGHDIISVKCANLAHPDLLSAMEEDIFAGSTDTRPEKKNQSKTMLNLFES
jgi:hypothetical protein